MAKLVTIYGGSGFVGRYIAQRMAREGWRVRVAVRRPNEAIFVKTYGSVGQVEPVLCNIRDDASVRLAMGGADAVVNCVGILNQVGKNKFDPVQHEGAERVARIAQESGVETMVHLSAIGADAESNSDYGRTKALGEEGVLQYMPNAMILRPSVIFGSEDGFFNRFASQSRFGPILPFAGGHVKMQPVYVDDVAEAAVKGVLGEATGIYELGGPEVKTLKEILREMLQTIHRRRLLLNLPMFVARFMAFGFDMLQAITFGLFTNGIITRDQLKMLANDNVVSEGAQKLEDLGIKPTPTSAVLESYLWRFRPSGQYDAIKASAKNLQS